MLDYIVWIRSDKNLQVFLFSPFWFQHDMQHMQGVKNRIFQIYLGGNKIPRHIIYSKSRLLKCFYY